MANSTRIVSFEWGSKSSSGTGRVSFGGAEIPIIAGPCSIENREHFLETAKTVKASGATLLRGGIFKMRTSSESFQGLGSGAFSFINEVKNDVGLPLVSEVIDPRQISDMHGFIDMFQVGSRNMYNYSLLKELGQTKKPVMLKRGFSATVDEWLKAADYILGGGNENVILCERGIRTFETTTRNSLDLNSVAYIKTYSQLPIIVDPSHGTGRPELIKPMSLAAIAAGADGLMIEVHPRPQEALSDGHQALTFPMFDEIVRASELVAKAVGRRLAN